MARKLDATELAERTYVVGQTCPSFGRFLTHTRMCAAAKQILYHDLSMEQNYNPPLEDKTWYLLAPGILSRNKDKIFDLMEQRLKESKDSGHDVSDYPCYSARTFKSILAFLPLCPDLKGKFERKSSGEMKQTGSIYFVILGLNTVLSNPVYALRLVEWHNAPQAVIVAVSSRADAEELVAEYPPMNSATLEHMEYVQSQARQALRESIGNALM
ncbi:hypothetical protein C8R43DRAFT_1136225 [Mycena crocata]|nr:hypothetical protein C8R43DRAFT_1136225 [Mycena crocata]